MRSGNHFPQRIVVSFLKAMREQRRPSVTVFCLVFSPLSAALVGARIDDANVECPLNSGFYNAEKRLA
jgi:hypothetical protein